MGYIFNNVISGFVWEGVVHRTPNFWHVNGNSSYEKTVARKKKTECIECFSNVLLDPNCFDFWCFFTSSFIWFIHVYPFSKRPGFIVWFAESRDSPVVSWWLCRICLKGSDLATWWTKKIRNHKLSQVNHNPSVIPHFALSLVTVPNLIAFSLSAHTYIEREREGGGERERERDVCVYVYIYVYMCV